MATRRSEAQELVTAGGCAAKYAAGRLDELLAGFVPARGGEPPRRAQPGRRRGRLQARRRARARLHGRLLPARRRRSARLRRHRRGERAQRRLRDGRGAAARALDRGLSRGVAHERARRDPRRGGRARSAPRVRCSLEGTRSATTSRSTGSPWSASRIQTRSGRRARPRRVTRSSSRSRSAPASCCTGSSAGWPATTELAEAVRWMRMLNREAAEALRPFEPSAVTDVTGFGLLGHAHETASRSGVRIVLDAAALPALPGALEVAGRASGPGGDARNREFAGAHVEVAGRRAGRRGRARLGSADVRGPARLAAEGPRRRARRRRSKPSVSSLARIGSGRGGFGRRDSSRT